MEIRNAPCAEPLLDQVQHHTGFSWVTKMEEIETQTAGVIEQVLKIKAGLQELVIMCAVISQDFHLHFDMSALIELPISKTGLYYKLQE